MVKSLLLHTLEKNQSVIQLLAWLVEKGEEEEEEGVDAAAARALRQDGSILERWERGIIAMAGWGERTCWETIELGLAWRMQRHFLFPGWVLYRKAKDNKNVKKLSTSKY